MTFWPLTNSDFPTDQTFHQFHDLYTELDLHRIMSGFHGAFATGMASQQGTLTLPDTWFRPPFWDLLMLQLLRPNSSNLPCLYSTFHLEYPLVLSRFCFKSCALPFMTNVTIPYHKLSFPESQYSIFASLWCVYLTAYTVCQGLLLLWVFYPESGATFMQASRAGICQGTFEIITQEVLWSIWGSHQIMKSQPPNVTWHSGTWSYTVTPSIDQAFH